MNSPAIRFAGFTDDWEQRKLGGLGRVSTGNTPPTSENDNWSDSADGHVWITPTDINACLMSNSVRHLTDIGWAIARVVPAFSVLITSIASIGKNAVNTIPVAFNQQINAIVPEGNDAYFILSAMEKCKERFAGTAGQTATAIINKTEFEKFSLSIPSVQEQQQVGGFFFSLDRLITLHQREHDKTVNIKKALLEKMFPKDGEDKPEIRFAGFTGAWEQRELGDVATVSSGYMGDSLLNDGKYKLTRIETISDGFVDLSKVGFTNSQPNASYRLNKGDILYSNINSLSHIGKVAIYHGNLPLYHGINLLRVAVHESQNPAFLFYQLNTGSKKKWANAHANKAVSQASINQSLLAQQQIQLCEIEEQSRIGVFFSNIDRLIALHQRELTKLQNIKKALLEKMFV